MGIRAVSHIGIGLRDLEAALPFYRDLLGMSVIIDEEERFHDPATDPPVERVRRAVFLRWAEGPETQFFVLHQEMATPGIGEPAQLWQIGLHHIGLWVDDVEPYIAGAAAVGGSVVAPPVDMGGKSYAEPDGSRIRSVFLRDPEGNYVQLDQHLASGWG
jgi:catechol 2,3-dioxygenase-like lactoylglutathione lyase family enzyme